MADRLTRRSLLAQAFGGTVMFAVGAACETGDQPSQDGDSDRSGDERSDPLGPAPDVAGDVSNPTNQEPPASERAVRVPAPIRMVRSSWSTDPFARGCYSYMAVGATPELRKVLAAPVADRLFFAGEATAGDHPATVHGAAASGLKVAANVVEAAETSERIVVLGAGIAGVTAARQLIDEGYSDVVVIEARDRVGGRITSLASSAGVPLELGASWVHDVDASDLAGRLAELRIDTLPFDYDSQRVLGDDGVVIDDIDAFVDPIFEAIDETVDWAESQDDDQSVLAALVASRGDIVDTQGAALAHVDSTEIASEYGASLDELSAWYGFEEGSDGDDLIVLGGYDGLVTAAAANLSIELSRPITAINWSDDGVVLVDAAGVRIEADRVILTVPLGVLKAGAIAFDPPLPADKLDAIDRLGFGVLEKVWFEFDEPFWSTDALMWTAMSDPGTPFREWFNLAPLLGRPILLGLAGGSEAAEWVSRPDAEVRDAALATLQRFADAGW